MVIILKLLLAICIPAWVFVRIMIEYYKNTEYLLTYNVYNMLSGLKEGLSIGSNQKLRVEEMYPNIVNIYGDVAFFKLIYEENGVVKEVLTIDQRDSKPRRVKMKTKEFAKIKFELSKLYERRQDKVFFDEYLS